MPTTHRRKTKTSVCLTFSSEAFAVCTVRLLMLLVLGQMLL
ncbi:hypothetical protein [Nocardia gipuzkoensis]|nr:hypothetical protein [Nocardia gipuzkoensis]